MYHNGHNHFHSNILLPYFNIILQQGVRTLRTDKNNFKKVHTHLFIEISSELRKILPEFISAELFKTLRQLIQYRT